MPVVHQANHFVSLTRKGPVFLLCDFCAVSGPFCVLESVIQEAAAGCSGTGRQERSHHS